MKLEGVLLRRAWRFCLSGLMVTGIHVIVALAFVHYVANAPAVANGVAFTVATCFSYLVNTLWSFSSPLHGHTLFRFLCVSGLGCGLAMGISGAAAKLGWTPIAGIGAVALLIPPITFLMHNFWTYRSVDSKV